MFWVPYINPPARVSPDASAFRIFAEPQFQTPPFGAVKNPYAPHAIVQLPKIWKHGALPRIGGRHFSSCHIALVLQPYRYPPKVKPVFRERWSDIVRQLLQLRLCLQPGRGSDPTPQGGYTPLIITQSRPAGLYIYTTDSLFNKRTMTDYMTKGRIVTPPTLPRLLGNASAKGPALSLDLFNSSSDASSTPMLDLLSVS
ncbi:hypothetical protein BDR22DRAFT_888510 [Usnea florida]